MTNQNMIATHAFLTFSFLQTHTNPASFPGNWITGIISESARGFGYRSVKD
jgi:hypothetical protein